MGKIVVKQMAFRDGTRGAMLLAYEGNVVYAHGGHAPSKGETKRVPDPQAWLRMHLQLWDAAQEHLLKDGIVPLQSEQREYAFTHNLYKQLVRDLF
jgi:hypothetical protein